MIKWIKLFTTGVASFVEIDVATGNSHTVPEHTFTDAADAVSRHTVEAFIFWDGQPIGSGSAPEEGVHQTVVEEVGE